MRGLPDQQTLPEAPRRGGEGAKGPNPAKPSQWTQILSAQECWNGEEEHSRGCAAARAKHVHVGRQTTGSRSTGTACVLSVRPSVRLATAPRRHAPKPGRGNGHDPTHSRRPATAHHQQPQARCSRRCASR
eukprot:scaffold7734_cov592-Prasinococcus_capsulatus_cf.AAC.8